MMTSTYIAVGASQVDPAVATDADGIGIGGAVASIFFVFFFVAALARLCNS